MYDRDARNDRYAGSARAASQRSGEGREAGEAVVRVTSVTGVTRVFSTHNRDDRDDRDAGRACALLELYVFFFKYNSMRNRPLSQASTVIASTDGSDLAKKLPK